MKKFAAALTVVLFSFAAVSADEFRAKITKVDGDQVTFIKSMGKKGKGTKAEPMTLTAAKNVKVSKGKYDKKAKTFSNLLAVEGGLTNAAFSSKKGVTAQITTSGSQITEIVLIEKGKKKKKNQ